MARTFQHHMLVRQEHLNQYGSLFGGRVLAVIDEMAFIACTRTFPGRNFVTRAVLDAEFSAPAHLGDTLEFNFGIERLGETSVQVGVEMLIYPRDGGEGADSFDGTVVMVSVDEAGSPIPVQSREQR
ncbi:MAG: acyl-CoA thioesterase [Planctomycetota bacterium]|jgi:acyl-CoA hydrolase